MELLAIRLMSVYRNKSTSESCGRC